MEPKLDSLARTLRHLPENRPVMYLLTHAMRGVGELQTVAVALECWLSIAQVARPDPALMLRYGAHGLQRAQAWARGWLQLTLRRSRLAEA